MISEREKIDAAVIKATVIADVASPSSGTHLTTYAAPTFASPVEVQKQSLEPLKEGDQFDDFELIRELGSGAFATVYLARQISLGRKVALKISPNRGHEAQTLASLEHDHIVHVFSELVDQARQSRLLCMQYVAGATLADVMKFLTPAVRTNGTGKDFLAALDKVSSHAEEFRPSALQERESIAEGNFHEAICWIGARLSSALEFAHDKGILHRDIKPANILLNPYGRPFLADFNLACKTANEEVGEVGGTLPYMSPEHLHAFASRDMQDWERVDERSDVYSLGVVLYELATGQRPYSSTLGFGESLNDSLMALVEKRLQRVPTLKKVIPAIPDSLDQLIRRCIAPEPRDRFASAAELRQALEACRSHIRSLQQLPPPPRWARYLHRHPFISLLLISTFTNILATVVNWSYNLIQIVNDLNVPQRRAFDWLVIIYNSIAFPVLVGITTVLLRRAHRKWTELHDGRLASSEQVAELRQNVNFLATWSIIGSLTGWLPGSIVFPFVIHYFGEPINLEVFLHFVLSFTLSGMIAITYCYLGSQYVVLRVLLPALCGSTQQNDHLLRIELKRLPGRLIFFQMLAGIIPLSGALMIVMIGHVTRGDNWFRLLVCMLIILGMVGFVLALQITQYLQRVLNILLNPERRSSDLRN